MKILFLSHGSMEFDGRLRELMKVSSEIGDTEFIVRTIDSDTKNQTRINKSYPFFIVYSLYRYLKQRKDLDILFVDNRKAAIPGLVIATLFKPRIIIQDVRELYLPDKKAHLARKVGNFFESRLIKKADILICASKYRSKIMKDYYKLNKEPISYDNIRRLEYDHRADFEVLHKTYDSILNNDSFKIISSSGHVISRTNDKLVESMTQLDANHDLLLVGGGSNKDKEIIKDIINKNNLVNVHLIGKVNPNDLKYLIQKSHVGIVNYHDNDLNNKYCASGKIFEYIFEGIPVLTTENIPLKDIVNQHQIGIATNDYAQGIKDIQANYQVYKDNALKLSKELSVEDNNHQLAMDVKAHLSEIINER